jgi:hypothetical protein
MTNGYDNKWTIDEEKKLVDLCQDSHLYTASEMAAKLGKSRNAVIGKIHRRNIHWRKTREPPDPNAPRKEKPTRIFSGKNANYSIERKERNAIKPRKPKPSPFAGLLGSDALWAGKGIPLDGAPPTACRWPFLDSFGRHSLCCGQLIYAGMYCEDHYVMSKVTSTRHRSIVAPKTPIVEQVG